jgi:hypothetical protein
MICIRPANRISTQLRKRVEEVCATSVPVWGEAPTVKLELTHYPSFHAARSRVMIDDNSAPNPIGNLGILIHSTCFRPPTNAYAHEYSSWINKALDHLFSPPPSGKAINWAAISTTTSFPFWRLYLYPAGLYLLKYPS